MPRPRFVIAGPVDTVCDEGTLFWSNESGWGSLTVATVFTQRETETLALPLEAVDWIELPA